MIITGNSLNGNYVVVLDEKYMDLSIIIVNYKTSKQLTQCLESITQNEVTYKYEVCVVDNNSADQSVYSVRSKFPDVNLIINKSNVGYGAANNIGINSTCGRYILLLNPDTTIPKNALEEFVNYLEKHPDVGAVGPKIVREDGSLDKACRRSFPTPKVAFYRLFGLYRLFPKRNLLKQYNLDYISPDIEMEVDSLVGACMMFRRNILQLCDAFDERFYLYGEDIDLCYRIKKLGFKIIYFPGVTILHYKGMSTKQNLSRATIEFYRAMYLFHRKHYASDYFFVFNWLVYAGIFGLFCIEVIKNLVRSPLKRGVGSSTR